MSAPVLTDRQEESFWAQDPTILRPDSIPDTVWAEVPADRGVYRDLVDVSVGLGAAFLIWRWIAVGNLGGIARHSREIASGLATDVTMAQLMQATRGYRMAWTKMAVPALQHAMMLGATVRLTPEEELSYATMFAHQIYDYINESSANALVTAYQAQLADRWNPDVAWARSMGGYGLEQRSMMQYLKMLGRGEHDLIIPTAAKRFVERALHERAQRIGANESYRAMELGKSLVWMSQYQQGKLPRDVQRKWLTAEDERVCPICGPMDRVQVPMMEPFLLPDGNKLWAPGVHPNCRCAVELAYPEGLSHPLAPRLALAKRTTGETPEERRKAQEHQPRDAEGHYGAYRVAQRIEPELKPEIKPEIRPEVKPEIRAEVRPEIKPEVRPLIQPQIKPQMRIVPEIKPELQPAYKTLPLVSPVITPELKEAPTPVLTSTSYQFQRPSSPYYAFANDLEWFKGKRHAWLGDTHYELDDTVDLDQLSQKTEKGETRFALQAKPLQSNMTMAQIASNNYEDSPAWIDWERSGEKGLYDQAAKNFYSRAKNEADRIIDDPSILSTSDIREIYRSIGDDLSLHLLTDRRSLRHDLKMAVEYDTETRDAFFHYLELHKPDVITGSVGNELAEARDNMPREPHTTDILVFDRGFEGGFESTGGVKEDEAYEPPALVHGRYAVYNVRIVPLKPALGSDAPSSVEAIRYIHLRPIGPNVIHKPVKPSGWSPHG